MNALKGYKTVVFNVLALLAIIGTKLAGVDFGPAQQYFDWFVIVVNLFLRFLTTTPVFESETKPTA